MADGARSGLIRNRSGRPYRPSVLRGYERALNLRVLPALGHLPLSDLRRRDVQLLADRLLAEGLEAATVVKAIDPLRSICRYARRQEWLDGNPTADLDLPRPRGRRERVAPPDEAAALIAAVPEPDQALWATAFYAGLRRGELRALRVSDADLDANAIRVTRVWDDKEGELDGGKSHNAERAVGIASQLRGLLVAHLLRERRRGDNLLFGVTAQEPFQPSNVRRRALTAWKRAGLEPITLHEARHTWVSMCIAAGVNPHTLMVTAGHGSYAMTMEHYGKTMPGAIEDATAKLGNYLASANLQR